MEILSSSLSPGTNKFENLKKILYNIYTINELLKLNNNLITVIVQLSADLTP